MSLASRAVFSSVKSSVESRLSSIGSSDPKPSVEERASGAESSVPNRPSVGIFSSLYDLSRSSSSLCLGVKASPCERDRGRDIPAAWLMTREERMLREFIMAQETSYALAIGVPGVCPRARGRCRLGL